MRETIQAELHAQGAFDIDVAGYAGGAAAAELIHHWRSCRPPLDAATRRGDVEAAIAALRTWADTLTAAVRRRGASDGRTSAGPRGATPPAPSTSTSPATTA